MKRFLMIGLVLLVAVLANGCASYNIQSVPSQIDESKTVKVEDNDTTITAFPILTEEDSKKYFDKNLIGNNLLAVYLNVLNTSPSVVEIIKSNLIIQAQQPSALAPLPQEDVYKAIRRGWAGKASAWFFMYGVGAPISAAHTASVNKDVKQDLQNKALKLGDVKPKTFSHGFLWFKIPDEAMHDDKLPASELKISIKKDGKLVEYNLPITGDTAFAKATASPPSKTETKPADSIVPIDKPVIPPKPELASAPDFKSLPPALSYSYILHDANNNRILEGGEEITLKVEVENKGRGAAKDVQVILSGNKALVDYLGERKIIGDIKPSEKKIVEFKAILPAQIPAATAELSIEIKEGRGYSPSEVKALTVAMKPADIKKVVEVISEINIDDIPPKTRHERKEDFAVVIGISNYREKIIPSVKYAKRDAEIMAGYLENVVGIPKTNIKLLIDGASTKSDLEAYLEDWLKRRVKQNSTVFVYYAGHGAPDTEGKEAHLVPYEGHPDYPSKLYSLKRMYESLNKLPAKDVIVMLDSCFSGAEGRSVTKTGARPLVMSIENPILAGGKIMVLAAAAGSQISSDYDKVQHGLFTYYLLRGMRGEADVNKDGIVSLGELYEYTRTNVSEKASIELNRDQTPLLLPSIETAGVRLSLPVAKIK